MPFEARRSRRWLTLHPGCLSRAHPFFPVAASQTMSEATPALHQDQVLRSTSVSCVVSGGQTGPEFAVIKSLHRPGSVLRLFRSRIMRHCCCLFRAGRCLVPTCHDRFHLGGGRCGPVGSGRHGSDLSGAVLGFLARGSDIFCGLDKLSPI